MKFCDQILQVIALLDKKIENINPHFLQLKFLFFLKYSPF